MKVYILGIAVCVTAFSASYTSFSQTRSGESVSRQVSSLKSMMESYKTHVDSRVDTIEDEVEKFSTCAGDSLIYAPTHANKDSNDCITPSGDKGDSVADILNGLSDSDIAPPTGLSAWPDYIVCELNHPFHGGKGNRTMYMVSVGENGVWYGVAADEGSAYGIDKDGKKTTVFGWGLNQYCAADANPGDIYTLCKAGRCGSFNGNTPKVLSNAPTYLPVIPATPLPPSKPFDIDR